MFPTVHGVVSQLAAGGGPPMPTYSDDFEAHTIATGIPTGWSLGDGSSSPTWEVTGTNPLQGAKSLKSSNSAGGGDRSLVLDGSSLQDGTVSALIRPVSDSTSNVQPSLLGRYADGDNYVHMRASTFPSVNEVHLYQEVGGSATLLKAMPYPVALGTTYRAKLVMDGATLWALLFDVSDNLLTFARATTTVTASGQVGIRHIGAGEAVMLHDDFQAATNLETPALVSRSLDLNGSSQYARLLHESAFNASTGLTIEADCYPDSTSGNRTIVARFESSNDAYILRIDGGVLRLYAHIGGSWRSAVGATSISTGTWTHLAGTYDGSTLKVFVNGTLDGQTAHSGSINSVTAPLYIGRATGGEYWDGKLTNVRVWTVDRGGSLGASIDGSESGLLFAFEESNVGAGRAWLDASVNLRDALIVGSPTWSSDVP